MKRSPSQVTRVTPTELEKLLHVDQFNGRDALRGMAGISLLTLVFLNFVSSTCGLPLLFPGAILGPGAYLVVEAALVIFWLALLATGIWLLRDTPVLYPRLGINSEPNPVGKFFDRLVHLKTSDDDTITIFSILCSGLILFGFSIYYKGGWVLFITYVLILASSYILVDFVKSLIMVVRHSWIMACGIAFGVMCFLFLLLYGVLDFGRPIDQFQSIRNYLIYSLEMGRGSRYRLFLSLSLIGMMVGFVAIYGSGKKGSFARAGLLRRFTLIPEDVNTRPIFFKIGFGYEPYTQPVELEFGSQWGTLTIIEDNFFTDDIFTLERDSCKLYPFVKRYIIIDQEAFMCQLFSEPIRISSAYIDVDIKIKTNKYPLVDREILSKKDVNLIIENILRHDFLDRITTSFAEMLNDIGYSLIGEASRNLANETIETTFLKPRNPSGIDLANEWLDRESSQREMMESFYKETQKILLSPKEISDLFSVSGDVAIYREMRDIFRDDASVKFIEKLFKFRCSAMNLTFKGELESSLHRIERISKSILEINPSIEERTEKEKISIQETLGSLGPHLIAMLDTATFLTMFNDPFRFQEIIADLKASEIRRDTEENPFK